MCISKKKCPVPFDQQPLNEYFSLKQSWLFSWISLSFKRYLIKLLAIFSFLFIISIPCVLSIIPTSIGLWKLIILNLFVVNLFCLLIFIHLYFAWSYVAKRLISATVFYEESGWYDGQIWIKSAEILTQDRLIGLYEAMPLLSRIKSTLLIILILLLLDKIIYSLLL
uniref:Ycf36 n=1 Tax=Melanthalia intermedia TaxID=172989 RepID=A0A345UAT1_9FLOR|nr:hypothetical protein [Melanthalia intermedia]AXI97567.1 hypothetical protein [Melanthalia intermedia]